MDLIEVQAKLPIEKLLELWGVKEERQSTKHIWYTCPFHHDTDPSFVVNKFDHRAHCFSGACVAHRPVDHVGLIELYEHLDTESAKDRLYEIIGEPRPINSLHDVLRKALMGLTTQLEERMPKEFFDGKGISPQTLKELCVGYSPSYAWFRANCLQDITQDAAAKLELFRTEMFDNAIIYPLFDGLGRMAGFRSRPQSSHAKYLANYPEYPLRSASVYGLHLVRGNQIILLEGPNDMLAWRSAGVKNSCAIMGTNLKQLDSYLTGRGFSDIVFVGDGDEGGRTAMYKAPDLIRVNVIPTPDPRKPMDPDEFAKLYGVVGISKLVNEAQYPLEMRIDSKLRLLPTNLTGKIMLIKSLAVDLAKGLHPIVVNKVQDKLAAALEIAKEDVISLFDLAEYDTTDLENKIVWHVFERGELADDIKTKLKSQMFGEPKSRKQFQELMDGHSPAELPNKSEGLTEGDVDKFLDLVKRRELKHILTKSAHSMSNLSEPLEDALNRALSKISDQSSGEIVVSTAGQLLELGLQTALDRAKNPGKLLGISFGKGFKQIDRVLQGLRPNCMYVLAATQGTGKSVLGLQWAKNMAFDQNIPVLWISLEMSDLDMSIRLLAKTTGISASKLMEGAAVTDAERGNMGEQPLKYRDAPLYVATCGGINIHQIVALVRKYKATKGVQVVFIDYIQLIDAGSKDQTMYERVGQISRLIKSSITMDKSIGLPVVAIAQLAKIAASKDVPTSEHIAESYKIAQDADALMTIKKLDEVMIHDYQAHGKNFGNLLLNIDKNRSGLDKQKIGLIFNSDDLTVREVL